MARAERVDVSKEELYKIFDQNIVLADAKPGALWAYDKADRGKYKKNRFGRRSSRRGASCKIYLYAPTG